MVRGHSVPEGKVCGHSVMGGSVSGRRVVVVAGVAGLVATDWISVLASVTAVPNEKGPELVPGAGCSVAWLNVDTGPLDELTDPKLV